MANAVFKSLKHVTEVHVFVDSVSSVHHFFDMGTQSLHGSSFSLTISEQLCFWFGKSNDNQLHFHCVPHESHWGIQYSAFKLSKSISIGDEGSISLDAKLIGLSKFSPEPQFGT